jgi:putative intracellular protease/amidase
MQIAILLFDRFAALDAVGPYQVLSRLPGADVVFAAEQAGPVTDDRGALSLSAPATLAARPPTGWPWASSAGSARSQSASGWSSTAST